MEWLIAFIGLIVAVIFWRAAAVLLVLGLLFFGGDYLYDEYKKDERYENQNEFLLFQAEGQENRPGANSVWEVTESLAPAETIPYYKSAEVRSECGLCWLKVEKRWTGTELTAITCNGWREEAYNFRDWEDAIVKFDGEDPFKMDLKKFDNSEHVYIPRRQSFSDDDKYLKFIELLSSKKRVALGLTVGNYGLGKRFFFTFPLTNSGENIEKLGQPVL